MCFIHLFFDSVSHKKNFTKYIQNGRYSARFTNTEMIKSQSLPLGSSQSSKQLQVVCDLSLRAPRNMSLLLVKSSL